jgi:predicted metal-dependent HD superfamily phosphohydrolase
VAALAPEAFNFARRQASDANASQRFTHIIQLMRLDNRHYHLHRIISFSGERPLQFITAFAMGWQIKA